MATAPCSCGFFEVGRRVYPAKPAAAFSEYPELMTGDSPFIRRLVFRTRHPGALSSQPAHHRHASLQAPERRWRRAAVVDVVFILIILTLYALTHWVTAAIARLGGVE